MDNNYQQNPFNTNQGYPQQPTPQQPTVAPETPVYANPYATQAPEAPVYANPYATTAPADPYATTAPADPYATTAPADPYATTAPAYADPYATTAPAYADPYGVPAPAPKKSNKGLLIGLIAGGAALLIIVAATIIYFNSDSYKYGAAKDLMNEGKYDEAIVAFDELGNYKDSADLADECSYKKAVKLMEDEDYEGALAIFRDLDGYEDSASKRTECGRRMFYSYVQDLENNDEYLSYYIGSEACTVRIDDEEELLNFWYLTDDNDAFKISVDMTSDTGSFFYMWDSQYGNDSTALGECVISELVTDGNSLTRDYYTGLNLPNTTNSCCDDLCSNLAGLLEESGLDLTPADLGFTGI